MDICSSNYNNKRMYDTFLVDKSKHLDLIDENHVPKKQCINIEQYIDDFTNIIYLEDNLENIYQKIKLFLNIRTEIIYNYNNQTSIINCNMLHISNHCVFEIIILKTQFIDNYIISCRHINGDNFIYSYIIDDLVRYFINNDMTISQYKSIYSDKTPPSMYHITPYCGKTDLLISILNMIKSEYIHISIDGIKYLIEFFHELSLDIKICYQLLIEYEIVNIFIDIIKIHSYDNQLYEWYHVYILKVIYKILAFLPNELKIIFSENNNLISEIHNIIHNDTNPHAINLAKEISDNITTLF